MLSMFFFYYFLLYLWIVREIVFLNIFNKQQYRMLKKQGVETSNFDLKIY